MNSLQEKILKFKRQLVNIFKFVIIVFFASITVIYAKNINSVGDNAEKGDKITAQWINDVNQKLTAPKTNSKLLYYYVEGSNVYDQNKNITEWNKLVGQAVATYPGLKSNNWEEWCSVDSTGRIKGHYKQTVLSEARINNRCSERICIGAFRFLNPIPHLGHCGTSRDSGGCNPGGYTIKCMYAEKF